MGAFSLRERLARSRFFRGEEAVDGPVSLNQRRVFILPNRRGLGLALVLCLQWLTAIQYSNNLAFFLSFLMVGIALLGIFYSFRNLAGLRVGSAKGNAVFAGEPAEFELRLDNPGPMPRIGLRIDIAGSPAMLVDAAPHDRTTLRLGVPTRHRGRLQIPTLTLSSSFPLGLFRTWAPINLKTRTLVYPRPARAGMPYPETVGRGNTQSADADDFHGFRTYQPGDTLWRIHWKGVAKGQGVQVKEYRNAMDSELVFDFTLTSGDREARLSQLCRWVLDAEQAGLRYALRLPHLAIAASCGAAHQRHCLEALALFPA